MSSNAYSICSKQNCPDCSTPMELGNLGSQIVWRCDRCKRRIEPGAPAGIQNWETKADMIRALAKRKKIAEKLAKNTVITDGLVSRIKKEF
jgi:ribosomal protein L37AE/L43A